MSNQDLGVVRQYDFSGGPNYTDSIYGLDEKECAETDNMFWDGELRTIPGAERLVTTVFPGSNVNISGMFQYSKKDGTSYFIATSHGGRAAYENAGSWSTISTVLSTNVNTYWDWAVFNDTLIAVSGSNAVQKWAGSGNFSALGGSPPQSRFITAQGDYLFLAGHTSNPSQIRYSDTATANVWPGGNTLNVGLDDGQIITGLQKFGDTTAVFKDSSIWLIAGGTPTDFSVNPTPSEVGCIAPNSIVLTDAGIFFWSEAGPALFNGFKSILLGRKLRGILEDIDWTAVTKIHAAYYRYRKQLLVSYQVLGDSNPGNMLLFDFYRWQGGGDGVTVWPITHGASSLTDALDSASRRRVYFGHSNGFVTGWDQGTTFNEETIEPRFRSRAHSLGKPDVFLGVRDTMWRMRSSDSALIMSYGADGATSFTQHGQTPVSLTDAASDLKYVKLQGDGTQGYIQGNVIQFELTSNNTTGFTLQGYEIGLEEFSRRG